MALGSVYKQFRAYAFRADALGRCRAVGQGFLLSIEMCFGKEVLHGRMFHDLTCVLRWSARSCTQLLEPLRGDRIQRKNFFCIYLDAARENMQLSSSIASTQDIHAVACASFDAASTTRLELPCWTKLKPKRSGVSCALSRRPRNAVLIIMLFAGDSYESFL